LVENAASVVWSARTGGFRRGPSSPFHAIASPSARRPRSVITYGQSHTEPRSDASNRVDPWILKRHRVLQRQLLSAALNRHLITVAPVTHDPPRIFPRCPGTSEKEKVPTVAHRDWGGIPEGDYLRREPLTLLVCRTPSPQLGGAKTVAVRTAHPAREMPIVVQH